jgi:hypothetical protein
VTQGGGGVLFFFAKERERERKKQGSRAAQSWEARACLQRENKAALAATQAFGFRSSPATAQRLTSVQRGRLNEWLEGFAAWPKRTGAVTAVKEMTRVAPARTNVSVP